MTREIKVTIYNEKAAFTNGDMGRIKSSQKELKRVIRQEKRNYKEKVEGISYNTQESDSRGLWNGMKLITGCGPTSSNLQEGVLSANEANQFFALLTSMTSQSAPPSP